MKPVSSGVQYNTFEASNGDTFLKLQLFGFGLVLMFYVPVNCYVHVGTVSCLIHAFS